MDQEQFLEELKALDLPVVKILLKEKPFDEWPKHLKEDAYKKTGLWPKVVYEKREVSK